ncbi:putative disease resistance RPP13-like protein 1 [Hevea brasiliensis]|uniref:putative disease resistance RPP13-like protein 1 n=1 Tax=Hevea brasiliensis TaxID=3981 RepID=UPI0025DDBC1B|nr:putative disease resistance RPP13-like protein 1 [Hevea brasiliensis]
MAAEAVAGAFLSSMFQFLFERMDSPEIAAFFKGHKLDLSLVKKLKVAMITVTGLLDHAEEKQIVVPAVKKWLDELKDAAYEADDLLDEIAYEALRSELEAGSTTKKLCRLFSSHNPFDMAVNAKLEKILELLEYLTRQMNALGLTLREGIGDKPSSHKTPTTSLPDDESSICGRKYDRKKITESLLSNSHGIGVICVVGIGGMGKTTLAQLVYNDKQVDRHFNLKAWVYVSEEFNVFKITTEIRSKVSSEDCKANNLSELQQELKQKLEGKKYLLVLDDVWSDKYAEWESLLKPLKAGAQGSKIVVTTRIQSIASAMENNQMLIDLIHPLEKLSDDDCWSMLATYAFHDEISNSSFEAVGKEIAKKCGGLPLALKTIGSLLRSKRNDKEWEKISQSNMWNLLSDNIVPALKLSYHYLPSHLKQCFAYCAVFPKGYEFYKEDLIPLWMAEGFIMEAKEGDDNEDLGDACFKDLVSRSFFQVSSSSQNCFVMHDHMHDLAKSISGEFCCMLDKNSSDKVPTKTRYLYTRHGRDLYH